MSSMSIYDHQLPQPPYDTHNLYTVTFFEHTIYTTVTNSPFHVTQWITGVDRLLHRSHSIVGLDIEWRPNFGVNIRNLAATLQLCVGNRCLIFQLIHSPIIPQSLINFLGNPNYTFTGVGVGNDVVKLREDYNLVVANIADVRNVAADVYGRGELRNAGIKSLTSFVLGKEIEKPKNITLSRWDNLRLYPAQVLYAAIDAFLSFEIARVLFAA